MGPIQRFEVAEVITSSQNGMTDVLDWLGFLCAKEYLVALLRNTHQMTPTDALKRSDKIAPHVKLAMNYIRQSQEGPPEVAFLPAYYAILNLMKVYVLLGPRHAELAKNRWHGATYDPNGKDSHSILTEEIKLRGGGAFPLFYEAITGKSLGTRAITLKVRDFLKYVNGVGIEYHLATGQLAPMCTLGFLVAQINGLNHAQARVNCNAPQSPSEVAQFLRGYTAIPGMPRVYNGPQIQNSMNPWPELRASVNTHLLYRVSPDQTYAMFASPNSKIEYPQELPIALLFFYMSSVVRYRPEFLARLRDSKYWPVISSARTHAFLDFLLAFWCYVQRRSYFVKRD